MGNSIAEATLRQAVGLFKINGTPQRLIKIAQELFRYYGVSIHLRGVGNLQKEGIDPKTVRDAMEQIGITTQRIASLMGDICTYCNAHGRVDCEFDLEFLNAISYVELSQELERVAELVAFLEAVDSVMTGYEGKTKIFIGSKDVATLMVIPMERARILRDLTIFDHVQNQYVSIRAIAEALYLIPDGISVCRIVDGGQVMGGVVLETGVEGQERYIMQWNVSRFRPS